MSKVITDGLVLTPTPFADGLDLWSRGDGTPGSGTYDNAGVFISADADFGGALEIVKSETVQRLRYMGETTVMPGCYLRITARVKALSGALPSVRIAGYAGTATGALAGVVTSGPATQLTAYGDVAEISAIVGTGNRNGVDLVWNGALYGHFGIDLTGPCGGLVRIDDIEIEDVSALFLRDIVGLVDVRDYGAVGDGVTDDSAAFEAADAAARGREVLVSAGTYYLAGHVTFQSQVRFEGTVSCAPDARFNLTRNYDYQTYLDAFGNEEDAFRKAYQALLNSSDHDTLDLGGRRIGLTAPMDMQAADPARRAVATTRVIRNGQFQPIPGPAWDPDSTTSVATYSTGVPLKLTDVVNAAGIQVGSLVTGHGVGREVYVRAADVPNRTVTLSQPLNGVSGTQDFNFTRFKYLIDFSGYSELSQFVMSDVEFRCSGAASGVILATQGQLFQLKDCVVSKPADRGLTSPGSGCQGMLLDGCNWVSNEQGLTVEQRKTIGFNANANDIKLRCNRAEMFRHFGVISGCGGMVSGNHVVQGDAQPKGARTAGLVIATPHPGMLITANSIDNCYIEWTNEHEATPELGQHGAFGGLTITGNRFSADDVAPWFRWIVVKPFAAGHFIHGLSVIGNVFRTRTGTIERVEDVDTTYAGLDMSRMRDIAFSGNIFHGVIDQTMNPVSLTHRQTAADRTWVIDTNRQLPFRGRAQAVDAVVPVGQIAVAGDMSSFEQPWVDPRFGPDQSQLRVVFSEDVTGTVRASVRMDAPV